jgi:GNAT superfamily N-acetyltransferase
MRCVEPLACSRLSRADDVDEATFAALRDCWVAVTNAGGAAGFPFPPVTPELVEPHLRQLVGALDPAYRLVLTARLDSRLAGWVSLVRNDSPLTAHWATVRHLQTHPSCQRQGVGTHLMSYLHQVARDDLGLEHLWLAVRGGLGLEGFYARLGWQVAGTHRGALRFSASETRDEIIMSRDLP